MKFEQEDKLLWHVTQLHGVAGAEVREQADGLFLLDVTVESAHLDMIWGDLVEQVEQFESSLGGSAAIELDIQTS